jgi:hypothetical protein
MNNQTPDIDTRLERLESESRRMKKIAAIATICASVLVVSGQTKMAKTVEATEFRLVDTNGKVRGRLLTNDSGQTLLTLSDSTGQINSSIGTGTSGSSLSLGSADANGSVLLTSASNNWFPALRMTGSGGKLELYLNGESGPKLAIEDSDGYSSVLGRSDLIQAKTGKKEQTPAASLVLFDKEKKVLWSAP